MPAFALVTDCYGAEQAVIRPEIRHVAYDGAAHAGGRRPRPAHRSVGRSQAVHLVIVAPDIDRPIHDHRASTRGKIDVPTLCARRSIEGVKRAARVRGVHDTVAVGRRADQGALQGRLPNLTTGPCVEAEEKRGIAADEDESIADDRRPLSDRAPEFGLPREGRGRDWARPGLDS